MHMCGGNRKLGEAWPLAQYTRNMLHLALVLHLAQHQGLAGRGDTMVCYHTAADSLPCAVELDTLRRMAKLFTRCAQDGVISARCLR